MGTFDQWQRRITPASAEAPGLRLSDVCGPNPTTWRSNLPVSAPVGTADDEYARLEARVFDLVADLAAIDQAWEHLGQRRDARIQAAAAKLAGKLAEGVAATQADLAIPAGKDIDQAAEQLVMQAQAARQAIDRITGTMRAIAGKRAHEWLAASHRGWQDAADPGPMAQMAANTAMANAEQSYTAYLWVRKLPGSIQHGVQRSPTDGNWQGEGPAVEMLPKWQKGA